MRGKRVDTLMVVEDDGRFIGIASARDIEARESRPETLADAVQRDVPRVVEGSSAKEAFEMVFIGKAGVVPVVDAQGKLTGIVTRGSLAVELYQALWDVNGQGQQKGQNAGGAVAAEGDVLAASGR